MQTVWRGQMKMESEVAVSNILQLPVAAGVLQRLKGLQMVIFSLKTFSTGTGQWPG